MPSRKNKRTITHVTQSAQDNHKHNISFSRRIDIDKIFFFPEMGF